MKLNKRQLRAMIEEEIEAALMTEESGAEEGDWTPLLTLRMGSMWEIKTMASEGKIQHNWILQRLFFEPHDLSPAFGTSVCRVRLRKV